VARFPCDHHRGPYKGAQQTAYPALLNGSFTMRERQRLCPDCFSRLLSFCELTMIEGDSEALSYACIECDCQDTPVAVFVTAYPAHEDRRDFYGRACTEHATTAVAERLFGPVEPPQGTWGQQPLP